MEVVYNFVANAFFLGPKRKGQKAYSPSISLGKLTRSTLYKLLARRHIHMFVFTKGSKYDPPKDSMFNKWLKFDIKAQMDNENFNVVQLESMPFYICLPVRNELKAGENGVIVLTQFDLYIKKRDLTRKAYKLWKKYT